jgi:hypothetical protein
VGALHSTNAGAIEAIWWRACAIFRRTHFPRKADAREDAVLQVGICKLVSAYAAFSRSSVEDIVGLNKLFQDFFGSVPHP